MQTIGRVQFESPRGCLWISFDFVYVARAESCAWRPIDFKTFIDAKIAVVNDDVAGLILSVHGFGQINPGKFVDIQNAICGLFFR